MFIKYNSISFFSGAMGLDIGLENAGFNTLFVNEIDKSSVKTIKINRSDIFIYDKSISELSCKRIEEITNKQIKNIDVIAGGPPCQAFSVIGKRKGINDDRGKLIFEFIRMIEEISPKCFIMENVRGLHSMSIPGKPKGSLLIDILEKFNNIGYKVDCFLVNAVNYGVPQIRERLICIGNKYNIKAEFPLPEYSNRPNDGLPPYKTLKDVIGEDFIDPDPEIMNFSPRKLYYLSFVPPGGNWRNMPIEIQKESMGGSWYLKGGRSAYWRRLSFDYPSPTIVTMPNHAGTSLCHPSEIRTLTVGECAAIQGFPKSWKFMGTVSEKYKQIGNAVPPRLGEIAGITIKNILDEINLKCLSPVVPSEYTITHIRPHVRTRTYWKNGKVAQKNSSYYDKNQSQLSLFN